MFKRKILITVESEEKGLVDTAINSYYKGESGNDKVNVSKEMGDVVDESGVKAEKLLVVKLTKPEHCPVCRDITQVMVQINHKEFMCGECYLRALIHSGRAQLIDEGAFYGDNEKTEEEANAEAYADTRATAEGEGDDK